MYKTHCKHCWMSDKLMEEDANKADKKTTCIKKRNEKKRTWENKANIGCR